MNVSKIDSVVGRFLRQRNTFGSFYRSATSSTAAAETQQALSHIPSTSEIVDENDESNSQPGIVSKNENLVLESITPAEHFAGDQALMIRTEWQLMHQFYNDDSTLAQLTDENLEVLSGCPSRKSRLYEMKFLFDNCFKKRKELEKKLSARKSMADKVLEKKYGPRILKIRSETKRTSISTPTLINCHHLYPGPAVCIDLDFLQYQNPSQQRRTFRQLEEILAANATHSHPLRIRFTGAPTQSEWFERQRKRFLPNLEPEVLNERYLVKIESACYSASIPAPPDHDPQAANERSFIMLSPDAREDLIHVDRDTVYIIGGIVDKGSYDTRAHGTESKARRLGIQTRRLPLFRYADWIHNHPKAQCLPINQCVAILTDAYRVGSMKWAVNRHVPRRHLLPSAAPNNNNNNDDLCSFENEESGEDHFRRYVRRRQRYTDKKERKNQIEQFIIKGLMDKCGTQSNLSMK